MLSPNDAHAMLQAQQKVGMDDPTEAGLPWRWWYDNNGVLCCAVWRSKTCAEFPQFTRPNNALNTDAPSAAPRRAG